MKAPIITPEAFPTLSKWCGGISALRAKAKSAQAGNWEAMLELERALGAATFPHLEKENRAARVEFNALVNLI